MAILKDTRFWIGVLLGWLLLGNLIARVTGMVGKKA